MERVLNRHVGEKVLEPWAYARKKIIESTVRETLIVCGFSEEMTCYLSSDGAISQDTLLDTICEAPITLDDKLRLIDRMSEEGSLESKETSSLISERHQQLSVAAEALYSRTNDRAQGKVFSLFTEWYDTDELRLKSETSGLFTTLDAVEDFIRKEEADNETGDGYYRVEQWDTRDAGWELPRYDYFYYKGRPCWFEQLIPEEQENGNKYYTLKDREFTTGLLDLDLKTPYCPGDIVLIDCRPFGPPFHAMMLETRNQFDCCFPNIVFCYPGTDKWLLTPLKHKRFYKDISRHTYEPMLSPLYRLRKAKDAELSEEDEKFLELSGLIAGSEEKAKIIWNRWEDDLQEVLNWNSVINIFKQV